MISIILTWALGLWTVIGFGAWFCALLLSIKTGLEEPIIRIPFYISLICGPAALMIHLMFLLSILIGETINK